MDNFAKIEQKIIRIFSLYYNVAYNSNNIKEYERLREWYDKNYTDIKIKLKKLYHFSNVEMENRVFDIDKALIYKIKNDEYSEQEFFLRAGILNKSEIHEISFEEKLNNLLDEDNLIEINNNEIDNNYEIENNLNPDIYQEVKNNQSIIEYAHNKGMTVAIWFFSDIPLNNEPKNYYDIFDLGIDVIITDFH